MKVGIVFHKNPFAAPAGIDLVRLRALAGGLISHGIDAEILAPVSQPGTLNQTIPVKNLEALADAGAYDLVKTCYHFSIKLIGPYRGPVVSRIVRVVDERLPERDEPVRKELLQCQELIHRRAVALALNNVENKWRWRRLYGNRPPVVLVPTGCPAELPPVMRNPFSSKEPVILFLGSIAAPRMLRLINEAAQRVRHRARIHLLGSNKVCLYGGGKECTLDNLIIHHGEIPEDATWDYVRHAHIGLALATGPHPFDNDVSKILNYLRGGLPVLSEEPILNNRLVRQTGFGRTFAFGDGDDMVAQAFALLDNPPRETRESVMHLMATQHSWDQRVATYVRLFRSILEDGKTVASEANALSKM